MTTAQPYLRAVQRLPLSAQRRAIRAWSRSSGAALAEEVVDAEATAPPSSALMRAVHLATEVDGLIVASLDCLSEDLALQESVLWRLQRAGASLVSVADGGAAALGDDAQRIVVRDTVAVACGFQEAARRAAKAHTAEQRGHTQGRPPFGYRVDSGELVPDESEQATLARIRELHEAGESLRSIASTLEAEGRRSKSGDRWHPAPLARIIERLHPDVET